MAKEYIVLVQAKHQEASNKYDNLKSLLGKGSTYSTLAEARKDLKNYIALMNKPGERTERRVAGGIGLVMEISAEEAEEQKIVRWRIRGRKVIPWETIDEAEI
jgi:hypothetical protein